MADSLNDSTLIWALVFICVSLNKYFLVITPIRNVKNAFDIPWAIDPVIVFKKGTEIDRTSGYQDFEEFERFLNNAVRKG